MKRYIFCFFLSAMLCLPIAALAAAPEQELQELKSQYLSLRNTDIALSRADEWISLARQLEQFADKNPSYSDNPSALLNASILLQILYHHFGGADRAQKVAQLLERIARDYPGHHLVDDALLKRGDMLLYDLEDVDGAERAYEELVRAYPRSELVPVVENRLQRLRDGSYRNEERADESEAELLMERAAGARVPLVVIDPGHGGEDFGAQGIAGLLEKDVALAISFELERLLKERMNAIVRLTRRSDIFVPLAARTQLANDFDADLFVSIHANSSPAGKASGFEVYYLDNSQDQASQALAERENASTRFEGPEGDLQFMLSDLIQNAKLDDSIILANVMHRSLKEYLKPRWSGMRGIGVKKAPFYVLVGAHMPCVLVETAFMNHRVDGARLTQKEFRNDLAYAVFLGVQSYYKKHIES